MSTALTVQDLVRQGYSKAHAEQWVARQNLPAEAVAAPAPAPKSRHRAAPKHATPAPVRVSRKATQVARPVARRRETAQVRTWLIENRPDLHIVDQGRIPQVGWDAYNAR